MIMWTSLLTQAKNIHPFFETLKDLVDSVIRLVSVSVIPTCLPYTLRLCSFHVWMIPWLCRCCLQVHEKHCASSQSSSRLMTVCIKKLFMLKRNWGNFLLDKKISGNIFHCQSKSSGFVKVNHVKVAYF